MTRTPPLLPAEILRRVLRLASIDGHILLYFAGFFALLSALGRDGAGAVAGCAAAGAGALELHGLKLLRHGESRGMSWLVRSQILLLVTVLLYVLHRLTSFNPDLLRSALTADMRRSLEMMNVSEDVFIETYRRIYPAVYKTVGAITLLYQGSMAWYYHRQRQPVAQALNESGDHFA